MQFLLQLQLSSLLSKVQTPSQLYPKGKVIFESTEHTMSLWDECVSATLEVVLEDHAASADDDNEDTAQQWKRFDQSSG